MKSILTRPSSLYDDEMVSLPDVVNSLFQNSFLSPSWRSTITDQRQVSSPMNVYEDRTSYYILALLPGIEPGQLDISVKENVLSISGKYDFSGWPVVPNTTVDQNGKSTKENGPEFRTLLSEIPHGEFSRQIQLPAAFDTDKVEANYEHGMLKLVVPKSASSQAKRIEVKPTSRMAAGTGSGKPQLSDKSG